MQHQHIFGIQISLYNCVCSFLIPDINMITWEHECCFFFFSLTFINLSQLKRGGCLKLLDSNVKLWPHHQKKKKLTQISCYFQGSAAISSADLFGDRDDNLPLDLTASDLINRLSFQVCLAYKKFLVVSESLEFNFFVVCLSYFGHVWSEIILLFLFEFPAFCLTNFGLIFVYSPFQAQQDISSLKNIAGETGKKLSSLASNLMTDLQDRIL